VLLGPVAARAQATEKSFTGLYFGVEASALNVIAGAQVSGVDTLAQDTRGAVTFAAGGRYEVSRLVLGIEFGAGWEDGNLALDDSAAALHIDYRNHAHTRIGGTVGLALGPQRRTHLFGYLSELSRSFEVTVTQAGVVTEQQDEQGLLRYGGGIEQVVASRVSIRGTLGSSRADFDGRPTNIQPTRPLEAGLAILFRF
jgi:hypothetical protein